MPFDPVTAAIRFGTGLSPVVPPPEGVGEMMARLTGPDEIAARFPLPTSRTIEPTYADLFALQRARRDTRGTDGQEAADAAFAEAQRHLRETMVDGLTGTLTRGVQTADGLRERLVRFWADHFTVEGPNTLNRHLVTPYVEEAIRPHVAGRFGDMLRAVILHPMMIVYLDQRSSLGPGSVAGLRTGRGLNENLARELIELHTLGVGAGYSQSDVRELAELLTGLTLTPDGSTEYRPNFAEPGSETVLGQTFSADARIETVHEALDALARRPETAAHIARKLAVHFVADDPDPDLVAALADAFSATGGALDVVIGVLLAHPAAWSPRRAKVKPPFDFLQSAFRALAIPPDTLRGFDVRTGRQVLLTPMLNMGQPWEDPAGPDGWPEAPAAWITPQFMAARIGWAFTVPQRLLDALPDPRDFVLTALGPEADPATVFAASAAESRAEAIGLVLVSAAFQRR